MKKYLYKVLFFSMLTSFSASFTVTSIPSTGTPPRISTYSRLTIIDDNLYTFGGIDDYSSLLNSLYKFDLVATLWTQVNTDSDISPSPRLNMVMTSYNGNIYIFGGETEDGVRGDLWMLDLNTFMWNQLRLESEVRLARSQASFTLVENYLILFGGISNQGTEASLLL